MQSQASLLPREVPDLVGAALFLPSESSQPEAADREVPSHPGVRSLGSSFADSEMETWAGEKPGSPGCWGVHLGSQSG